MTFKFKSLNNLRLNFRVIIFKLVLETFRRILHFKLEQAGFDLEDNIILTEQLFNEAAKFGDVIKSE